MDDEAKASIQVWGPSAWRFMHAVSFAYPERPDSDDRRRACAFFSSASEVLPCVECKLHFMKELSDAGALDPGSRVYESRDSLSRLLVEIHNSVNHRLGKKTKTYDRVRKEYLAPTSFFAAPAYALFLFAAIMLCCCHILPQRARSRIASIAL